MKRDLYQTNEEADDVDDTVSCPPSDKVGSYLFTGYQKNRRPRKEECIDEYFSCYLPVSYYRKSSHATPPNTHPVLALASTNDKRFMLKFNSPFMSSGLFYNSLDLSVSNIRVPG